MNKICMQVNKKDLAVMITFVREDNSWSLLEWNPICSTSVMRTISTIMSTDVILKIDGPNGKKQKTYKFCYNREKGTLTINGRHKSEVEHILEDGETLVNFEIKKNFKVIKEML